jgi:hypothetical protein
VKKIADEHGARVRIVNLHADAAGGDDGEGPVTGAQVSLSFSRFAPVPSANSPSAADAPPAAAQANDIPPGAGA